MVRDGRIFERPPVTARHDVVVVGGGVSGLAAAFILRHRDCLLLEKESHWGGNAYTMEYQGFPYATGSAFLSSNNDAAYAFAKEIDLDALPINNWDGSIIRGEYIPDTWGDGIDRLPYTASVREGFKRFKRDLLSIDVERHSLELFKVPLSQFMKESPAELKLWWDAYGLSNWGATTEETPAALAIRELQSFAGDNRRDVRFTWLGGNGAITKRLAELLQRQYAPNMQNGATVVAVTSAQAEVQVTYIQGSELKTVAAKAVIMALPKFIARRVIEGLPERQSSAMNQIRYIPYPVVNLIFDKPVFDRGYDTWCPGNIFTDFVVADWVLRSRSDYRAKARILTCYTPMHEEDRGYLLSEQGARKIAANVLRDFQRLGTAMNVDPVEVHIYRRGHPLFKSTLGLYTDVQPVARQPVGRVFFANSDSEGPEPTIDGAIISARRCAREVESRLAGVPMSGRATRSK
jgi:protoporphyrinogen oxidase